MFGSYGLFLLVCVGQWVVFVGVVSHVCWGTLSLIGVWGGVLYGGGGGGGVGGGGRGSIWGPAHPNTPLSTLHPIMSMCPGLHGRQRLEA